MTTDLSGKRILITGGTGFLGARLVERLYRDHGVSARLLVRDLSRVPRIARLPVEIVAGDVLHSSEVDRAVEGCDIVFHCAYGNRGPRAVRWRVNVEGTRNILIAASKAKVERFVHVSTFAVYGHPPDGDLDETAPRRYCNDDYSDSKLEAERIVTKHAKRLGLPFVVLQPTVIYGPYAPAWTVNVLNRLRSGRVILVNGGDGLCNAVYVDDVISALLAAGSEDKALGEVLLVSAEEPITWKTFYRNFESMMGEPRLVEMTASEARAYAKQADRKDSLPRQLIGLTPLVVSRILRSREGAALSNLVRPKMEKSLRMLAAGLLAKGRDGHAPVDPAIGPPIHPLSPWAIRRFESRIRVRIDKARRILGYRPVFTFESGIKLTEQWAKWANLLTSNEPIKRIPKTGQSIGE